MIKLFILFALVIPHRDTIAYHKRFIIVDSIYRHGKTMYKVIDISNGHHAWLIKHISK